MAVSMNTLTLVMLPLACAILHMHAHTHTSSQHTGKEMQRRLNEAKDARDAGSATEKQLAMLKNVNDGSKYLAHFCFPCIGDTQWLFLHSVCVFLLTLSSSYFFSLSFSSSSSYPSLRYSFHSSLLCRCFFFFCGG